MKIKQLEIERDDLLKLQQAQSTAVRDSDIIIPSAAENATLKEAESPTPTHANVVASEIKKSPVDVESKAHESAVDSVEESKKEGEAIEEEAIVSSSPTAASPSPPTPPSSR